MDKLIKKSKKTIDKLMDNLVKKDIPRDKKIKACESKRRHEKK